MDDLVERLRARLPYLRNKADRAYFAAAIDALAALIAAGDKLLWYAEHHVDCPAVKGHCDCGYDEKVKAWQEVRGDGNAELR